MKAITQDRYGSPDVLALRELDRPVAGDDEVLVRVRAAAVNAFDWHAMRGDPYLARMMFGLRAPKNPVRGRDFAGIVEAVGRNVTRFVVGDEVYGDLGMAEGAFAEYAKIPADKLALKPANLTFEQAAAVPLAGSTALVGLRDVAKMKPGQHVLINGASGGVGTFAVQVAKSLGVTVTAVCSTRNVKLVQSLGADHVVDYKREDFTQTSRRYDVVLDLVGNRSLGELRSVLKPDGLALLSGGGTSQGGSLIGPYGLILRSRLVSRFISHRVVELAPTPSGEVLAALADLIEAGDVSPVVDRTFPLAQVPDAIRYLEVEHASAKVVIVV